MQVLVVTSLFASFLAVHASASRYHFALARDGLLPRALARTHPKYGSPIGGSAAQLALTAIVVIAFALAGQDPYLTMGIGLYGVGVIGIVDAAGAGELRRDPLLPQGAHGRVAARDVRGAAARRDRARRRRRADGDATTAR